MIIVRNFKVSSIRFSFKIFAMRAEVEIFQGPIIVLQG